MGKGKARMASKICNANDFHELPWIPAPELIYSISEQPWEGGFITSIL